MRRFARIAFASGSVSLVACSLVLGFEPPEYVEPADDGALADVAVGDALTPSDAADAGPFCTNAWDFCDEFDRDGSVKGEWTTAIEVAPATGRLENGSYVVDVMRTDGGGPGSPGASLQLKSPWTRRRIHVQLRTQIDVCPTIAPGASIVLFYFPKRSVAINVLDEGQGCKARIYEISQPEAGTQIRNSTPPLDVPVGSAHDFDLELPDVPVGTAEPTVLKVGAQSTNFFLTPLEIAATEFEQLLGAVQPFAAGMDVRLRHDRLRVVYLR